MLRFLRPEVCEERLAGAKSADAFLDFAGEDKSFSKKMMPAPPPAFVPGLSELLLYVSACAAPRLCAGLV
jgi:hypothetical protein